MTSCSLLYGKSVGTPMLASRARFEAVTRQPPLDVILPAQRASVRMLIPFASACGKMRPLATRPARVDAHRSPLFV